MPVWLGWPENWGYLMRLFVTGPDPAVDQPPLAILQGVDLKNLACVAGIVSLVSGCQGPVSATAAAAMSGMRRRPPKVRSRVMALAYNLPVARARSNTGW